MDEELRGWGRGLEGFGGIWWGSSSGRKTGNLNWKFSELNSIKDGDYTKFPVEVQFFKYSAII
jgi:hypothetical protein